MSVVVVERGGSPLILAFPHTGTAVPAAIWSRLNENGRMLADTDWHVERLYAGLLPDVTTVRATFHRYVVDANRDPTGGSLYPGQNTTELVPRTDFDGVSIWREGGEPTADDIAARVSTFHAPYHAALAGEIERVQALHGVAVLYDCHSIRSRVPFLFAGTLPDFNVGTDNGRTCAPAIEAAAAEGARSAAGFTSVLNGRFKGGWTTRRYGRPEQGIHAIQMELAQSTHLCAEAPPYAYDARKADIMRAPLRNLLQDIERIALSLEVPLP